MDAVADFSLIVMCGLDPRNHDLLWKAAKNRGSPNHIRG
jgi:hypothetical protein